MPIKRYVNLVLFFSLFLIVAAAGLNVLVDPYNLFGSPRVSGFNMKRPYAGDRGRVGKVHQVMRIQPRTIIVGNSRPEMGLNPDQECWSDKLKPVFNLAIPGFTVYEQTRYTQHAIFSSPVKLILMGVDFSDFLVAGRRHDPALWPSPEESTLRLSVDALAQPRPKFTVDRFVDGFRASVSLSALADSIATIALQRRRWLETRTPLGFNPAEGIYIPIVNTEGAQTLFAQKNRQLATIYAPAHTLYYDGTSWSAEFEALDRLAKQVQQDSIEIVFFINPYHAEYLLLLDAAGLWPMFEQWKKKLVSLAGEHRIPVWDFSIFDDHATELVNDLPQRGQSLDWFWEPAHYRDKLGSLMLSRILGATCDAGDAPGFGVMLNENNVQETLTEIRARRDAFELAHPDVRTRIDTLITNELPRESRSN